MPHEFDPLDAGEFDAMVLPLDEVPARFAACTVFEEEFVIAGRAGHPFFRSPTLQNYCAAQHILVSLTGGRFGFIDNLLAAEGLSRRIALTVPNFLLALATLPDTDLLAAVPRNLLASHAARFSLASARVPLPLRRWQQRAIVSKVALADAGIAWLFGAIERAAQPSGRRRRQQDARQERLDE